jgi:hypothetical protein
VDSKGSRQARRDCGKLLRKDRLLAVKLHFSERLVDYLCPSRLESDLLPSRVVDFRCACLRVAVEMLCLNIPKGFVRKEPETLSS